MRDASAALARLGINRYRLKWVKMNPAVPPNQAGQWTAALIEAVGSGEKQRNQSQNGARVNEWEDPAGGSMDALG